jgi:putative hydrolase
VAIDTDAHAPGQLEWQAYGCDKAARLGITPDDVVNTLPADELLAWASSHPT